MDTYGKHIRTRRMWDYVNVTGELSDGEAAHLYGCQSCQNLFHCCSVAETPDMIEDDNQSQQRSA